MKFFCAAITLCAALLGCAAAQSPASLSTTNPAHPDAPQAPLALTPADTLFISGELPAPATTNHHAHHAGAKPYPLDVCLVGDDDLHSMGKPIVFAHAGREIKVCCPECKETFLKEPATYLKKLDDIIKTKKPTPTTKPSAPKKHEHDHH